MPLTHMLENGCIFESESDYSLQLCAECRPSYGGGYLLYLVVLSNETCFAADISVRQVMSKLWTRLTIISYPLILECEATTVTETQLLVANR